MVAALASSDFDTVDGLLRGSLQRKPVAIAAMGMVKLYPFADPAFDPYLIRTVGFGDRLASTTALTPVKHIFHGPNIGAPLLESLNARDAHDINSNISIVLKQPGKPIAGLIKQSGEKAVVDTMTKKPKSIETFFKTVALVGAFEKTIDLSERVTAKEDRRLIAMDGLPPCINVGIDISLRQQVGTNFCGFRAWKQEFCRKKCLFRFDFVRVQKSLKLFCKRYRIRNRLARLVANK